MEADDDAFFLEKRGDLTPNASKLAPAWTAVSP